MLTEREYRESLRSSKVVSRRVKVWQGAFYRWLCEGDFKIQDLLRLLESPDLLRHKFFDTDPDFGGHTDQQWEMIVDALKSNANFDLKISLATRINAVFGLPRVSELDVRDVPHVLNSLFILATVYPMPKVYALTLERKKTWDPLPVSCRLEYLRALSRNQVDTENAIFWRQLFLKGKSDFTAGTGVGTTYLKHLGLEGFLRLPKSDAWFASLAELLKTSTLDELTGLGLNSLLTICSNAPRGMPPLFFSKLLGFATEVGWWDWQIRLLQKYVQREENPEVVEVW